MAKKRKKNKKIRRYVEPIATGTISGIITYIICKTIETIFG